MSSSAASCSMFCRRASIASGTTACSQVAGCSANIACQGTAYSSGTGSGRRTRFANGPTPTMPMLRRSHGRHRDLPECRPGTRTAGLPPAIRDHGVVIHHGQPPSKVETVSFRRTDGLASKSTANVINDTMTTGTAHSPLWHCHSDALKDLPLDAAQRPNRSSLSLHHTRHSTRFQKSP